MVASSCGRINSQKEDPVVKGCLPHNEAASNDLSFKVSGKAKVSSAIWGPSLINICSFFFSEAFLVLLGSISWIMLTLEREMYPKSIDTSAADVRRSRRAPTGGSAVPVLPGFVQSCPDGPSAELTWSCQATKAAAKEHLWQ